MRWIKWVLWSILGIIWMASGQNPPDRSYAATDSQGIAELSAEEYLFYQSEFYPLYLAERGRQSVASWRGMPPGFLDYSFENVRLIHPLWGYWDNQLLPIEIIQRREVKPAILAYRFIPRHRRPSVKPVTRIAYSEDFLFGLSYLDVGLTRYITPTSYVRLGGNNFLRSGSFPEDTRIQVNSYRGQVHYRFSPRWQADLWYWQLRHRFNLRKFPFFDPIFRIHRVGQIYWINLTFTPDSSQKLIFTPYGYKWGERQRTQIVAETRRSELYSLGGELQYGKFFRTGYARLSGDFVRHKITRARRMETGEQWEAKFRLEASRAFGKWFLRAGGGLNYLEEVGISPAWFFTAGRKESAGWEAQVEVTRQPQSLPLSALFWQDDSVKRLGDPRMPVRLGIAGNLKIPVSRFGTVRIQPFYHRFQNAGYYRLNPSRFVQEDFDNSGVTVTFRARIWRFQFKNEFTYNANYQQSFSSQTNNVLMLNVPLSLFNHALNLDGYAIYHFIGKWRLLEYHTLVNQYTRTYREVGNYHLLDFKLLAHIKTATLFFVWENTLSQDYRLVDGYWEFFRVLRFGIYWTLFD